MVSLIRRAIARLRDEPVLLLTAVIIGLTAAQDALGAGLSPDDIALAVAQALIGWAMRELVFKPTTVAVIAAEAFEEGRRSA